MPLWMHADVINITLSDMNSRDSLPRSYIRHQATEYVTRT